MKTSAVFLLLLGLAVARGEPASNNQSNQLENKNNNQGTKPSGLETASTRNQDLQISHLQYQSNQMANALHQDLKSQHPQIQVPQFPSQNLASQFQSQNQALQFASQDLNQQYRSQENTQQFHNQAQAQQFHNQAQAQQFHNQAQAQQFHNQAPAQQFHNQAQAQQFSNQRQLVGGSNIPQDQELSSLLQSQQRTNPSLMQAQSNEKLHDIASEQYSGNPQQEFYQSRRLDEQSQHQNERFPDPSGQQGQFFSGLQSTEMKTSGFPLRSAFDNRVQPIVLPRVSHSYSTSVAVSGLKNLPSVPALVYSAGAVPVPTAQAVAYTRPWHHGGAYLRQQWQTPYARYVYSHIL